MRVILLCYSLIINKNKSRTKDALCIILMAALVVLMKYIDTTNICQSRMCQTGGNRICRSYSSWHKTVKLTLFLAFWVK